MLTSKKRYKYNVFRRLSTTLIWVCGLTATNSILGIEILDKYAACVGSEVILESEITCERMLSQSRIGSDIGIDIKLQDRDSILAQLINRRLLLMEAKRFQSTEISNSQIEQKYVEAVNKAGGEDTFLAELRKIGMNSAEFKIRIKDQVLLDNYIQLRIRSFISIGAKSIDEYIEEHRSDLRVPSHISSATIDPVLREAIVKLLTEKETNKRIEEILVRSHENIQIYYPSAESVDPL